VSQKSLAEQVALDYLSFWMENWQNLHKAFDPSGEISKSISHMGWGLASMSQHMPSPFMRTRHPSRALSMHLGITLSLWGAAQQGLWQISSGDESFALKGTAKLRKKINEAGTEAVQQALARLVVQQTQEMGQGLLTYLLHPFERPEPKTKVIWEAGDVRLHDYAPQDDGIPVLIIPSLVNRSYILDMAPDRSFVNHLVEKGFKPYVLDWGDPGVEEKSFDLSDYYTKRLEPALAEISSRSQQLPSLIGYCMGGMMSLALAQRHPEIQKAALIATPWDFTEHQPIPEALMEYLKGPLQKDELLPPEVLQVLFYGLNPHGIYKKFKKLAQMSEADPEAQEMVEVEDWVNDGVPLSLKVMEECLQGWFKDNAPQKGEWVMAGEAVKAEEISTDTLVVAGDYDRIVPSKSSEALAKALPQADWWKVPFSHTGLMTNKDAIEKMWRPLTEWLKEKK
jgi:polyhydroxyalkanoate synthase subunit PhaC